MYLHMHMYYFKGFFLYYWQLPQQAENTVYLNGKVNRRVDYLLDALLKIEKDNFFKYMRMKNLFDINRKSIVENNHHHQGMKISTDMVEVCVHI